MEQLRFEEFFQEERKKEKLPSGEVISLPDVQVKNNLLYIIFSVEKPDGITVEKSFVFDLDKPNKKPELSSRILSVQEGVRVFISKEAYEKATEVSRIAFLEIKKIAYTIFRKKLKESKNNKDQLEFDF